MVKMCLECGEFGVVVFVDELCECFVVLMGVEVLGFVFVEWQVDEWCEQQIEMMDDCISGWQVDFDGRIDEVGV